MIPSTFFNPSPSSAFRDFFSFLPSSTETELEGESLMERSSMDIMARLALYF